jgi:septal ring factor EnvC (AmiA/AmiB activator)
MIAGLLTTFRHELVSTVLVTAFLGALMYPFKKIVAAYKETQTTLKGINEELANQRNNCLTTLQTQGDKQIVLLTSAVDVLREMHTDTKIMLDRLGRS